MTHKDTYQLKTLGRGLEVLALLKAAAAPVTLSALSRQLNEPTTVIFRILKTLEACGQIRQDGAGKAYGAVMQSQDEGATVLRAIATVRALGDVYPANLSVTELAKLFACEAADLAGQLRALRSEGVIEEAREGYWRLAHGCLALASPLIGQDDLAADLQPIMETLRRETRETVLLYRISGERQTVVVSLAARSRFVTCWVLAVLSRYTWAPVARWRWPICRRPMPAVIWIRPSLCPIPTMCPRRTISSGCSVEFVTMVTP
jgi:DNA-binding IclR family transcriptional regulator